MLLRASHRPPAPGRRTAVRCRAGPPPPSFDAVQACSAAGEALGAQHPSLLPLLRDGLLLSLPRPLDYTERRTDGYEEPLQVHLLGVAHLSDRSADDARLLISTLRPDAVALELCRSRAGMLLQQRQAGGSELSLSSEEPGPAGFARALARTLKLGGGPALLLRALLARRGGESSSAVGSELRAAAEAAREVGATLVLADRPVEITIKRALQLSSWSEKARVLSSLAQAVSSPTAAADTRELADRLLPSAGAVSRLTSAALLDYPGLSSALLDERDAFLAWSAVRSKAVNGKRVVVCILGAAHLRGVAWALQPENRGGLVWEVVAAGREAKGGEQPLWRRLAVDAAVGGALWAGWEAWQGRL